MARDAHLLSVCRYVEPNALAASGRAGGTMALVERVGPQTGAKQQKSLFSPWPVDRGRAGLNW